ncbi:MAG: tetratricopeptide repeat protein [Anaerolineae bacterium]
MFQPLGVFIDQFLRGFRSTREVLALKSGLELLRKGKVAEAIKEFDVAIKKDPRNGTAYTLRAVANGAIGKYPASLADANRALELNPNSATASAARGKAMFQLQMDRVAALAELDKAIALDSASAYQFVNRGDVRRQLMDWEGAIADFSKAVALAADSVTIFYERGRAYRMQRKLVKAAEDFNQVIELNPSEPQLALAFAGLGDVLRLAGDQKLGEANIQRGLEINREFVAIYFYQLGALFGRLEQFPTALNYYNEAERYGFQSVWLYFNRGTIRLKQDEYVLALTDLTEAIRLNPQNNKSRAHRALTFLANNDYANAISDSNQVLQAETDSETLGLAYYIRGMSRMQLDDDSLLSHAISDFSAAIQHGNSSANVYYSRGYCKLNTRDAVGALEDCNKAIELNPQDACAYYYRAKSLSLYTEFRPVDCR